MPATTRHNRLTYADLCWAIEVGLLPAANSGMYYSASGGDLRALARWIAGLRGWMGK